MDTNTNTNTNNDLNTKAVEEIKKVLTLDEATKIISNTFAKAEEELGRPMTYAEMRERFG